MELVGALKERENKNRKTLLVLATVYLLVPLNKTEPRIKYAGKMLLTTDLPLHLLPIPTSEKNLSSAIPEANSHSRSLHSSSAFFLQSS